MIERYTNPKYTSTLPTRLRDKYYAQDQIRDFWYTIDKLSRSAAKSANLPVPSVATGLNVSASTNVLAITAGEAFVNYDVEIPDSSAVIPSPKITESIVALVEVPALSGLAITGGQINASYFADANTDGVTTNYIKLFYREINGQSRPKAKGAVSYVFEIEPGYSIIVDDNAPASDELCLAIFTTDGSTITFTGMATHRQSVSGAVHNKFTVGASQALIPGTVVSYIKNTVIAGTGTVSLDSDATWSNNSTLGSGTQPISAVKLTDTTFLVAYTDVTDSSYGKAVVGTITNGVVTYGTPVAFDSGGAITYISAAADSATKVVIAYTDGGDSSRGKCIICTISGTVPTFGSEVTFNAAGTADKVIVSMSSGVIAIAYRNTGSSGEGTLIAATISGTVPTFGTASAFNTGNSTFRISACRMSNTVVYILFSFFAIGCTCAVVSQISGNSVSGHSAIEIISFTPSDANMTTVCAVAPDMVVMAYAGATALQTANATIVQVAKISLGLGSGQSSIRIGKPLAINSSGTINSLSITHLKDNRVYLAYQSSTFGVSTIGVISGSDIRFSFSGINFKSAAMSSCSAIALSSQLAINFYTDQGNSNRGTATPINISQYLGICQNYGTDGQIVNVALEGISNVHYNLTPGSFYYADSVGVLSTSMGQPVGLALSTTEILMDARAITGFFFELCGNGAMWQAHTQAGHGGTDTRVPYFTTVIEETLSLYATIVNQSTNGTRITINQKGIYTISWWQNSPVNTTEEIGITRNGAALTTNIGSVTGATVIARNQIPAVSGADSTVSCSVELRLDIGDIIRPQDNNVTPNSTAKCGFCIIMKQRLS